MTAEQAAEVIGWLKVLFVSQLALGLVAIVALVALTVVTLWRAP